MNSDVLWWGRTTCDYSHSLGWVINLKLNISSSKTKYTAENLGFQKKHSKVCERSHQAQKNLRIFSIVVNDKLLHEFQSVGSGADLPHIAHLLMSNGMASTFTVWWPLF